MKKLTMTLAQVFAWVVPCGVLAAQQGVLDGDTYTITVAENANVTLNADDIKVLINDTKGDSTDDRKLVKAGAGRLTVSVDLRAEGYDGEIQVAAGYFLADNPQALGGTAKGTRIENGATLEFYDHTAYRTDAPLPFNGETVSFEGKGVNNCGAIYARNRGGQISTNMMFAQGALEMTGDATVGYAGNEGYDGTFGTRNVAGFDMGGYDLTIVGGSNAGMFGTTLKNPGNIVVKGGSFTLENNTTLGGSAANVLTLKDGVSVMLQNQALDANHTGWKMVVDGAATVSVGPAIAGGWYGPVELNGVLTLKTNFTTAPAVWGGVFSGVGKIVCALGDFQFPNAGLLGTYDGGLVVNAGKISVNGLGFAQGTVRGETYGTVGRLSVDLAAEQTSGSLSDVSLQSAWAGISTNSTTALSYVCNGNYVDHRNDIFHFPFSFGDNYTLMRAFDLPMIATHDGMGDLNVSSAMLEMPAFINYGGLLNFNGSVKQNVSWIEARGGTVKVDAGAYVAVASNIFVGADYPAVARFQVKGTAVATQEGTGVMLGRNLADSSDTYRGIMEVFPGAVVTNSIDSNQSAKIPGKWTSDVFCSAGHGIKSMGSIYQYGGDFYTLSESSKVVQGLAAGNCGYYSMQGGTLQLGGDLRFAQNGGTYSVVEQSGGTVTVLPGKTLRMGCAGAHAVYYISGGTLEGKCVQATETYGQIDLVRENYESAANGSHAVLTLVGTQALLDLPMPMWDGNRAVPLRFANQNNSLGQLNLNRGGTVKAHLIKATVKANVNGQLNVDLVGNHTVIAFDGGVYHMRYHGNGPTAAFTDFRNGQDHVYAYVGGATFDVSDSDSHPAVRQLGAPVEAPTGNGVVSIALPSEIVAMTGWEFTGSPYVEIIDPTGSGYGATAIANFDTTSGKVAGITVMNRGVNYGAGTYAKIDRGGYANSFTTPCALASNDSGGLNKTGVGTLEIDQVCTYTGVTTVAAGTLKVTVAEAIDASAGVRPCGGTFDANALMQQVKVVGGNGRIINAAAAVVAGDLRFSADELVAGKTLSVGAAVTIQSGTKLVIENVVALDQAPKPKFVLMTSTVGISGQMPTLPAELAADGWVLDLVNNGKSLRLRKPFGMAMVVR